MNQENLKFLQDRLFYLGTEKRLYPELEKNIAEGKPDFKLSFANHYDRDKLSAELHFRKSDTHDMYFLNRYDATIQKPAEESRSHTFYLDNGKGVTMKEAYNLLDGRSVNRDLKNKEGEVKNAWIKLDFNNRESNGNFRQEQFYKAYGFDLHSELNKLPLPQMAAEDFKQFAASIERGNLQTVKFGEPASQSVYFVAANPQFKTIDVMDEKGRPLSRQEKNNLYALAEEQNKVKNQHVSGSPAQATDPGSAKTQQPGTEHDAEKNMAEKSVSQGKAEEKNVSVKTSKKNKVENLLPRKQTGRKKGLAM